MCMLRRRGPALGLLWVCAAAGLGCGDQENRPPPPISGSDAAADGAGGGDGGRSDGPRTIDSSTGEAGGSVSITIMAPAAGATVTGASVEVVARIVSSGAPVDTATIRATLGTLPSTHLVASGPDTYHGFVALTSLSSGNYDLAVAASTIDGGSGQAVEQVLINAGPIITILRPAPQEPTVTTLNYDFQVRISPALAGLHVGSVSARVGQCAVTLGAPSGPDTAREWTGALDLGTCTPRLGEGTYQFTVLAADDSAPAPVASTKSVLFVIDRSGPTIQVTAPMAGQLVGGIINVGAHITDPSGVNPLTVYATVSHGGTGFTFPLADVGNGDYAGSFDTRLLPNPTVIQFPALEVVADDTLGNHSTTGGILFTIDNVPPTGDFDPPPAQVVLFPASITPAQCDSVLCTCSREFDPVGADNPRDGATVPQIFDLRAEIGDDGNHGVGADFTFISGVAQVTVYVLDNTALPLTVDSDGDGRCDAINPNVIPVVGMPSGPDHAVAIDMVKIPPAGAADFHNPPTYTTPGFCHPGSAGSMPPATLCVTTLMTIALGTTANPSLIWTLPPVQTGDLCQGYQFDALANNISNGWICVAAAFVDGVGNRGVTRPLRLCVNSGGGPCPDPSPAPNCTGTLDRATGMVSSAPCTPRTLGSGTQLFFQRQ